VSPRAIHIAILAAALAAAPLPVRAQDAAAPERLAIETGTAQVVHTARAVTRLSIADPELADVLLVTPDQILVTAKGRVGRTNLILWHGDADATVYAVDAVLSDRHADALRERIRAALPGAEIEVAPAPEGVVLSGVVPSAEAQETVLALAASAGGTPTNLLRVASPQQVQLEVQVAEVSRSGLRQMGLGLLLDDDFRLAIVPSGGVRGDLSTGASGGGGEGGGTGEIAAAAAALAGAAELSSPFASAYQVFLQAFDDDLIAILSVLKEQGLARLLASPTLVALSGQEASFLVGGEFAVPVSAREGVVAIQFKEFGTLLRFTPTVVGAETISLRVEPEVSSIDFALGTQSAGTRVPGVRTRRGATTLRLNDGQSFVMAGLLREESSVVDGRFPFLGDVPWLGSLFTRKEQRVDETELVVAATVHLVRPLSAEEAPPLPGGDLDLETGDVDFFLRNRVRARTPAERDEDAEAAPTFSAPIGYSR
jgi:pilus assembly protein CpaC